MNESDHSIFVFAHVEHGQVSDEVRRVEGAAHVRQGPPVHSFSRVRRAYNAFSAFPEDAQVRIAPEDIRKKGKVPKNGSVFFTIFQTFMSGTPKDGVPNPYFGDYPLDFFDFIVIDECHRGGANR